MSRIRDMAKGEECRVRMPGICNFDSSTTVLAHVRLAGLTGYGQKAPDVLGAFCCSSCHDEIDRRTDIIDRNRALQAFYEGVLRTQYELIKRGVIKF